ncbi:MAG TPA: DnaA regulatory inactivator Hda [Burkholderiaceae bacterium]|jgi:DnaA family protein|nr:DnaA regulatory inactivator Hda [Burkholderiaceae bacterium]
MRQLALDLLQPLQPTLDNFVPGRNAEAVAALRMLAAGRLAERIVYLWGASGSGRTHLLAALAAAGAHWWTPQTPPEADGITLIDDCERLDGDAQIALFNRLNEARANARAACVIAGAAAPAQLPLREDVRTRLAWGYVYRLQPLTDDEKAAALAAHAAGRGLRCDPEVIPFLLTQLPRDMRTLVAALEALDAWALARKRTLTLALAREWLAGET